MQHTPTHHAKPGVVTAMHHIDTGIDTNNYPYMLHVLCAP